MALGIIELTKSDYLAISNTIEETNLHFIKLTAYVFICSGVFLFFIGFVGCCGSIKEDKCLLGFVSCLCIVKIVRYNIICLFKYMICVFCVIVVQSILVFLLFIGKQELITNAPLQYVNRLKLFNYTRPSNFEFAFHQIQLNVIR